MTVLRVSEAVCQGFPGLRIAAVVARGFGGHEPWPEADARWAVSPGERFRFLTPPGIRITTTNLDRREAARLAAALHDILETTSATYTG